MRRILVTGANKGIGLAIAKAILEEHADTFVYLGSRDPERGRAAAASLEKPGRVEPLELDVGAAGSVTAAPARLAGARLYGVVNNAGIGSSAGDLAAVLAVNAFGVQRVCEAFLPSIDRGGRVVNVTSASGPMFMSSCSPEVKAVLLDDTLTWPRLRAFMEEQIARGADVESYGFSKACANAYTALLAREHPELRINACTPGYIETDMTRPHAAGSGKSAAELGMKPPSAGARAPMFLLFGEPEGNGYFYGSDAQRSPLDRYRAPGSPPFTGA
ncbi:MAG: SDR family NAD(P)-dependent oxidoreductase [Labilithrix sp.]|nr:SDR family NAD(P)-dependent oxidoreductase [Labilithrix sp.]MCW5810298.1 SDR family NAD(P)-dependent oxidoreductase [Labilithrix sp.]